MGQVNRFTATDYQPDIIDVGEVCRVCHMSGDIHGHGLCDFCESSARLSSQQLCDRVSAISLWLEGHRVGGGK